MPKVNLLGLPRARPAKLLTETYRDPENAPGVEVTLTLRSLANNPHAFLVAQDRAKEFRAEYAETWYPHSGSGSGVEITETVAETLCLLEAMQVDQGEGVYSHEELVGLLVSMPNAYLDISRDVAKLNEPLKKKEAEEPETAEANGHAPNSSRVPAGTSCGPSATAGSDTLTSPSTPPGESTPSTAS